MLRPIQISKTFQIMAKYPDFLVADDGGALTMFMPDENMFFRANCNYETLFEILDCRDDRNIFSRIVEYTKCFKNYPHCRDGIHCIKGLTYRGTYYLPECQLEVYTINQAN